MLNDAKDLQAVYIVCGYTDLRKGIDSLSNIISQTYGMDPFQPRIQEEVCKLTSQQFRWLMEGLTLQPEKCIQKVDHPRLV